MKRMISLVVVSAFVLLSLGLSPSYAQWRSGGGWGCFGPGMMGWGWGFGWIFMIIFWGLVVAGLIFLVKWLASLSRTPAPHEKSHDSALDILKQRYAKGEINKEEFDQKKRDLM